MSWFNYYGLIILAVMMIPNVIYAVKSKGNFNDGYHNKAVEILEQVGRYACFVLMVFNIPYTWIGFYFSHGLIVYLAVNIALLAAYCIGWVVLWKKSGIVKALLLSIIPSLIFIFSGVMIASIPLLVFAIIFAATHILISVKNAKAECVCEKRVKKTIITVTAILLSFVLVIFGTLGGLAVYGQSSLSKLDDMSVMDMIKYDCTGKDSKISIAFIEGDNVAYHTYGAGGEEDTVYEFEIGSISKTFVGLLCAKAVNDGKLNLSDSVSKYLDLDDAKYYPTIERLLTHTSGYKGYYFEGRMIGNKFARITNDFYGISREQILDRVKKVNLEDKDYPFVYSNFGISVLGLVLEKIYNDDFTNLLNEYIESQLGLTDTKVAKQSGNLNGYWKWKENDGYVPAGSIISNIKDMADYLKMYMAGSLTYAEDTYRQIKGINATTSAYQMMNIRMDSVGMTWMLDDTNGIVWHNGATTNFNSYLGFTKDRSRGVVILSNLSPNEKISMTVLGARILTSGYSF